MKGSAKTVNFLALIKFPSQKRIQLLSGFVSSRKSINSVRLNTLHGRSKTVSSSVKMAENTKTIWKNTDCVCFDVDSTVITEEGIDELAKFCNKGSQVAEFTKKAMSGSMTFQESLKIRLEIIKPTLSQIEDFLKNKPPTLSPGISELVSALHSRKVAVFLITGGFQIIIRPIAKRLNIPEQNIYANNILFSETGEYSGFDPDAPTSKSGGKAVAIKEIKEKYGFKNLVMIGDGATDLEACPPADAFIGYGGNVVREVVQKNAKWFVQDFNELINALK